MGRRKRHSIWCWLDSVHSERRCYSWWNVLSGAVGRQPRFLTWLHSELSWSFTRCHVSKIALHAISWSRGHSTKSSLPAPESGWCFSRILSELFTRWPRILTDIAKLLTDIAELQSDKSIVQSDIAKLLADITELQSHVTELQPNISELQPNVAKLFADFSELLADFAKLQPNLAELFADVAVLQPNITELLSHKSELQPNVSELLTDITVVLADESFLFADESKLQSNVTKLQSHVAIVFTLLTSIHTIEPQVQPELQSFVPIILADISKIHRWRIRNSWIKGVLPVFTHLFTI